MESIQGLLGFDVARDGTVEVFDLIGHPDAKKCYAWAHAEGDRDEDQQYIAVLEVPPIDSATRAVQALIATEFKKKKQDG